MRKAISGMALALVTLASGTAFGQEFAVKKTLAVSGDRLFGIYLTQAHADVPGGDWDSDATEIGLLWQGGGLTPYTQPRASVDFFIIDHLSLGGSLAYFNVDGDNEFNGAFGGWEGNAFLFAPRVGGAWMFSDVFGIWPRGGLSYYSNGNGDGDHAWQLAFTAECAFILSPWQNFAFTLGPAFDIGMVGNYVDDADGNDPEVEYDVRFHNFGLLSVGVMGYFNL